MKKSLLCKTLIIDMHVHLSQNLPEVEWLSKQWPNTPQREHTAEQFIEKMNGSKPRIDKAVVFGFRSLASESVEVMRRDNDYVLETVERYPDRYIGA